MRLNRYHWGMTVGAAGLVGLAAYPVYEFIHSRLGHYGDAGSFFNFVYGVPIAALTALVTLAVARVGNTIAGQQGDIEILRFVEDKVRPALGHHRRLAVALGETMRVGDSAERISERILDCLPIDEDSGRNVQAEIFIDILSEMSAQSDDDAILTAHSSDIRRWAVNRAAARGEVGDGAIKDAYDDIESALKTAGKAVHDLHHAICEINDAFDGISGDLYAAMFSRNAMKVHAPDGVTPVAWLKEKLGDQGLLPDLLEDSLPDLNSNLRRLSEQTVARELVTAVLDLPRNANAIEIVGWIVLNHTVEQTSVTAATPFANAEARSLGFNLGAAYYLTAYLYIPDRKTVRETFTQLFGDSFHRRRQVAVDLLDLALPTRSELGVARLPRLMAFDEAQLNRLILVEPEGGEAEFYDPAKHGENLWQARSRSKPPFFSVRRLFNRFR